MKRALKYLLATVAFMAWTSDVAAQLNPWRDMHKVKRKETIYSIARDYGLTVEELVRANPEMAAPDYVLKKGTFVCIPYPQPKTNPATDTATVAPPSPQPRKREKTDVRNREVRVGVMLPLHKQNGDGRRMTEYYRGVLMACDSLKQNGISVDMYAWNVAEDMDIARFLTDEAAQLDLVIGPLYSKMMPQLSQWAKENDVKVLIPFSIDAPQLKENRQLFQVYQAPQDFNQSTVERFVQHFRGYHPVIIDCQDSTSTKGPFTTALRKKLEEEAVEYGLTSLTVNDQRFVQNFSMAQRNVVVLNSEHSKELRKGISRLSALLTDHPELEVTLFGYTDWMLYTQRNIENFYKLDVHIPAAFYYDAQSARTKRLEQKYRWNFHADMMNSLPRFALTGFDHAYFFIKGLHMYGKHFTGASGMVGYPAVQTPLQFERSGQGGLENKNLMFIHYTPEKRIETIKF